MIRKLALLLAALAAAATLTACDDRDCLSGHYMPTTTLVPAGKGFVPVTTQTWVCDQYEEGPK